MDGGQLTHQPALEASSGEHVASSCLLLVADGGEVSLAEGIVDHVVDHVLLQTATQ